MSAYRIGRIAAAGEPRSDLLIWDMSATPKPVPVAPASHAAGSCCQASQAARLGDGSENSRAQTEHS